MSDNPFDAPGFRRHLLQFLEEELTPLNQPTKPAKGARIEGNAHLNIYQGVVENPDILTFTFGADGSPTDDFQRETIAGSTNAIRIAEAQMPTFRLNRRSQIILSGWAAFDAQQLNATHGGTISLWATVEGADEGDGIFQLTDARTRRGLPLGSIDLTSGTAGATHGSQAGGDLLPALAGNAQGWGSGEYKLVLYAVCTMEAGSRLNLEIAQVYLTASVLAPNVYPNPSP